MCKVIEEWAEEERETGKIEGKIEGKANTLVKAIESLMENMELSLDDACIAINSSIQQYEEAKKLLNS